MESGNVRRVIKGFILGVMGTVALGGLFSQPAYAADDMVLKVSNVKYEGVDGALQDEVKRLLPEMGKAEVNVTTLSKQVQVANDAKAFYLITYFHPNDDGTYDVTVKADRQKTEQFAIGVNNFGNQYTGNWRTSLSYTNADIGGNSDTLALAYITSPNKMKDVYQGMVMYKWIMPNSGDTAYVSYGYSNQNMGNIYNIGPLEMTAEGKSQNMGLHYQWNINYTKAKKQVLDIGVEHKSYKGEHNVYINKQKFSYGKYDFKETLLNLTYSDVSRWKNQVLGYSVGYVRNLNGDRESYNNYRTNSDPRFDYFKFGANYQYKSSSDWIFGIRLNGQYTNKNLITTEQLGAGGNGSIRGFKDRVASGDKGVIGSVEIYTPQLTAKPSQRFVFFIDAGRVFNNHYNIGEKSRRLASVGAGYRLFVEDTLSVNIDYAKPISTDGIDMGKYNRLWNLNVNYKF